MEEVPSLKKDREDLVQGSKELGSVERRSRVLGDFCRPSRELQGTTPCVSILYGPCPGPGLSSPLLGRNRPEPMVRTPRRASHWCLKPELKLVRLLGGCGY